MSPRAIVTAPQKPNRKAYAAWLVVCLVWGTTYLAIAIAIETIPPLLMAGLRYIVAGAVLVAVLKIRGERMPSPAAWSRLALLGLLLLGFGNGGLVWAEQTIPSGFAALLVATTPFWMVGFDALMPDAERLNRRQIAGLIVGFIGIAMLVWPEMRAQHGGRGFLEGVVAAEIACVGWALGSTYARRRGQDENVLVAASFEMIFGGLFLVAGGLVTQEWRHVVVTARTFGAWLYLVGIWRDHRILCLRVRAQAPAGFDRVAVRVRESDHCRRARHTGPQRAVQPADCRSRDGRARGDVDGATLTTCSLPAGR
jgi:drug/metabolite transporter (DMT)-like permease